MTRLMSISGVYCLGLRVYRAVLSWAESRMGRSSFTCPAFRCDELPSIYTSSRQLYNLTVEP